MFYIFFQGVGFIKYTGFSDNECMHPKWETGLNIGQCLKVDNGDTTTGSFRATYARVKNYHRVRVDKYTSMDCTGSATTTWPMQQRDGCHHKGVTVDGAGHIGSGEYSFASMDDFKFIDFNEDNTRGLV
jgi:hypothetical protein